jgi:NAD-dependent SIR2 family protein deacetylase
LLVICTSAVVHPAASLPHSATQSGATGIELNLERAFLEANYFLEGKAGTVLPLVVSEITNLSAR